MHVNRSMILLLKEAVLNYIEIYNSIMIECVSSIRQLVDDNDFDKVVDAAREYAEQKERIQALVSLNTAFSSLIKHVDDDNKKYVPMTFEHPHAASMLEQALQAYIERIDNDLIPFHRADVRFELVEFIVTDKRLDKLVLANKLLSVLQTNVLGIRNWQ